MASWAPLLLNCGNDRAKARCRRDGFMARRAPRRDSTLGPGGWLVKRACSSLPSAAQSQATWGRPRRELTGSGDARILSLVDCPRCSRDQPGRKGNAVARTRKTRKAANKPAGKKARRSVRQPAIGGAFDILAGRKPDPDGPWKPGEGWAQDATGWGQWIKGRKPKPS